MMLKNKIIHFGIFILFWSVAKAPRTLALSEDDLTEKHADLIAPLMARATTGTLTGARNVTLSYALFEQPGRARGHIVLVPGYTESYLKYDEVIFDLYQQGFSVYVCDHRGMGFSQRLTPDAQVVHVDSFDDYVVDLRLFINQIVVPKADKEKAPFFLLGHSMGGLISAHLLAKEPERFAKAALSAPLFAMHTGAFPTPFAHAVVTVLDWLGLGENYAPGYGPYDAKGATVEKSLTTHSRTRFDLLKKLWLSQPSTLMSGPSNRWVRTVVSACERREELAGKIETPLLLFQAGTDHFGKPDGQNRFCAKAKNCRTVPVPEAFHELLMEADRFRQGVMDQIVTHFTLDGGH